MDLWTKEKRSSVMQRIRSKNTRPEMALRSALFRRGYRFRIHGKHLPGKPDIILSKHKVLIFVHGCFWHLHAGCNEGKIPKTNTVFWREKLSSNVKRDKNHRRSLTKLGWKVIVIWECQIEKQLEKALDKVIRRLGS